MLKITGCILILLAGAAAGYVQSRKLSMRVSFLEQCVRLVSALETEIRYNAGSIGELIKKHIQDSPYHSFLKNCLQNLQRGSPFEKAWSGCVEAIPREYGLLEEDRAALDEFGKGLGVSDTDGQVNHCKLYLGVLRDRLKDAKTEKEKKGKLYFMLGTSLGAGIVLLLC